MICRVDKDSAYFSQVDMLFTSSFEHKERALDLAEAHEEGTRSLALAQGDLVVAFANYRDYGSYVYIEHIATQKKLRGKGVIAPLFSYFKERWAYILCEVNPHGSERLVSFYEREGFAINPYEYIVPPYGGNPVSERYLLMSYPTILSRKQFDEMTTTLFKDAYLGKIKK
jgi:GNAT superfamily N-acetyltransferase